VIEANNFEVIIGLEIHVELKTKSKMFCGCDANWFGKEPNTLCCPVCLGLPGALPVPNKKAVEWCVMLGLALDCVIPEFSKFDRKNYFYPDLPKGYQISQYDKPFAINGHLVIPSERSESRNLATKGSASLDFSRRLDRGRNDNLRKICIRRVHMEEDTGKLIHAIVNGEKCTLIDFNRSGVPLVEIVTEPDIRSSEEARSFLKKLHQIVRYLGISDADMEKGSMRLEPNISVRKLQSGKDTPLELPSYKVEVKNINSFSFAKKAIDYEIERHINLLTKGEIPKQETRGWDEKKGITYSQRSKEEAHDYRYFPEPDIPPIRWATNFIRQLADQIPELPDKKLERFMKEFGLSEYDVTILTDDKDIADYYERAVSVSRGVRPSSNSRSDPNAKVIANWIINKKADINKTSPEELVKLITQQNQKVNITEEELVKVIKKIIEANPKAVADYKSGKEQALMFLVGQVMRETKGKVGAEFVKKVILKLL